MSCAEFLARLQEVLDQDGNPQGDRRLAHHASYCTTCHERLVAQDRLFLALSSAAREWCEPDGERRKPASMAPGPLKSLPNTSSQRNWQRLAMYCLTTSAALVALILWCRPEPNSTLARTSASPAEMPGPQLAIVSAEQAQPVLLETSTAAANPAFFGSRFSLTNFDFAVETQQISLFYDAMCKSPPIPDPVVPQVDQLADEFLPLAQPFVSVLNVLRRTLPGTKAPTTQPNPGATTHCLRGSALA